MGHSIASHFDEDSAAGEIGCSRCAKCTCSCGGHWHSRSRRVTLLVLGIILLSAADLAVTMAYARGGGMMEANPIALYLVRVTQSPWALVAYKMLTVGVCVALLYRLRKYAISEAAAWCAVGILTAMSFMWHDYSSHIDEPEETVLVKCDATTDHWLVFD